VIVLVSIMGGVSRRNPVPTCFSVVTVYLNTQADQHGRDNLDRLCPPRIEHAGEEAAPFAQCCIFRNSSIALRLWTRPPKTLVKSTS
jgi:hypothetical protein